MYQSTFITAQENKQETNTPALSIIVRKYGLGNAVRKVNKVALSPALSITMCREVIHSEQKRDQPQASPYSIRPRIRSNSVQGCSRQNLPTRALKPDPTELSLWHFSSQVIHGAVSITTFPLVSKAGKEAEDQGHTRYPYREAD